MLVFSIRYCQLSLPCLHVHYNGPSPTVNCFPALSTGCLTLVSGVDKRVSLVSLSPSLFCFLYFFFLLQNTFSRTARVYIYVQDGDWKGEGVGGFHLCMWPWNFRWSDLPRFLNQVSPWRPFIMFFICGTLSDSYTNTQAWRLGNMLVTSSD
jgi:hypothetical protein